MRSTFRSAQKTKKAPLEIGWREWALLPSLCDAPILAKIDTGAKTSAIHAYRIREETNEGRAFVEFYLHPVQNKRWPEVFCVAPIHDRRIVRSSNGAEQERIVILSRLRLGKRAWPIELSLANRDDMGFRLLIGRDAMRKNVIIHPSRSFLLGCQNLR
jgi:hypothetical protein